MTISRELAERVCPCAAVVPGRVYPLEWTDSTRREDDEWAALVHEVTHALHGFGFPTIEPDTPDWYALSWCLWRYLYGHQARGRHGADPATATTENETPTAGTGTDGAA